MTTPTREWKDLGSEKPAGKLVDDRLALHLAVQLLASFGQTLVAARPDDSHRSMTWDETGAAFVSEPAADGLRAAIGLNPLRLELHRRDEVLQSMDLQGRTTRAAQIWLGTAVGAARGSGAVDLEWPEYSLPDAMPDREDPLAASLRGLNELARWYHDASSVLTPLAAAVAEASQVRCWPHHFDIATILTFPDDGGGDARYVGLGMSPGDDGYSQPYFYVNGWPAPDPRELPPLEGPGVWHTQGWIGAVLTGEALTVATESVGQRTRAEDFLDRALSVMRSLLI